MTSTAQLTCLTPRIVHDESHDWRGGLLFVLAAILALGWIDSMDNADFWQKEAMRAQAEVERRNNLESLTESRNSLGREDGRAIWAAAG